MAWEIVKTYAHTLSANGLIAKIYNMEQPSQGRFAFHMPTYGGGTSIVIIPFTDIGFDISKYKYRFSVRGFEGPLGYTIHENAPLENNPVYGNGTTSNNGTVDATAYSVTVVVERALRNTAPSWKTIPTQTTSKNATKTVALGSYVSDADGNTLTYTASSSNTAAITVSVSGSTLTVRGVAIGSATVTVTANDGYGGVTSTTFLANCGNTAPSISTIPNQTVTINTTKTVALGSYASDIDGQMLTFSATSSNPAAITVTLSGSTLILKGIAIGSATITVIANDNGTPNGTATKTFTATCANTVPIVSLSNPTVNVTLYENDVFNISGTASDADNGNTVTVRYQINAFTTRAIKAFLSDGSMLESFSKSLTFKGGNLYDGTTLIAENLSDGVAHTLKVWATDDQGGTSAIREIPFYVVPNRAPLLTVNPPVISGNINSDKFMITGTFEDSDGNNTIVSYRLNGGNSVQVAEGVNGPFEFELSFGQLVVGANEIVIEAVDSYGAKVSKTVKLNKAVVETPLLKSTARYKINPPTGSAQAVLLWIQRDEQLDINVSMNMTMIGEAESFVALAASNTAPVDQASSIIEDEFYYEADSAKDNIIVQIDMTRSSVEVSDAIHLISGVLE